MNCYVVVAQHKRASDRWIFSVLASDEDAAKNFVNQNLDENLNPAGGGFDSSDFDIISVDQVTSPGIITSTVRT